MKRRLKTRIIDRMKSGVGRFVPSPALSTPPARGVRYFEPIGAIAMLIGKVNTVKEGRRYKKHIVARRTSFGSSLFQLYTYHFPTHWSEGCIANRNLIKEAQRRAHALEHDHSPEAYEWRIRFFKHYFRVFKGGAKPEPGLKPYSRFYQYVYVAIYRELQAAQQQAANQQPQIRSVLPTNGRSGLRLEGFVTTNQLQIDETADISFVPILDHTFSPVSKRLFMPRADFDSLPPPPNIHNLPRWQKSEKNILQACY